MRKEVIKPMKAIRIVSRSIRDAFKSFKRNFSLSIASILCTTITLILVSVAVICGANIENATRLIESELSIVVYLTADTIEEDSQNMIDDIKSQNGVEEVLFKSKDEWKVEMTEYSETFETVLNYIEDNPFLDSLEVKVNSIDQIEDVAKYIEGLSKVETVKYGEGSIDTLITIFDMIEKVIVVVVVSLIIVTIFLIGNTIKLTILNRKNTIEIMRLVGASNFAIKLPFLIEGFLIGIVGSIIPICITIYGYVILYSELDGYVYTTMLTLIKPYNFVFYVSAVLVIIGAIVGMFGSVRAVRKHLKI